MAAGLGDVRESRRFSKHKVNTRMAAIKFVALALLALAGAASASEFTSPHVAHLTSSSYEDAINDGKAYFVK